MEVPWARAKRPRAASPRLETQPHGGTRADGTLPTLPVEPATPASRAHSPTGASTVVTTPDDALYDDESRRIRGFAIFVIALVVAVAPIVELIGGDLLAARLHQAGLAIAGVAAAWILRRVRARQDYRSRHNLVFGLACVAAVATGLFYWGPLSAALLVVPFGAFVFSNGRSLAAALAITASCCASHGLLMLAILLGWMADRSLIRPPEGDVVVHVAMFIVVQSVFIGTFVMARLARQSQARAVADLDRTVRALRLRGALLTEAKQELSRVLKVGGPGRYSDQVIGSFRLGMILGRGGMGDVYAAEHVSTKEAAAVKLLHAHVLADPDHIRRFLREVRIVASLDEPHIVRVLEVPRADSGLPYLAMEHLRGESLAQLLERGPVMRGPDVVSMVRQVGRGLAAAHAAGIIHRDLKPHNLLLAQAPHGHLWKILDFGVCKLTDHNGSLTNGNLVGTPAYMAPEQARGEEVDHRADIYSLAVIAYRALTGHPPFGGTGGGAAAVIAEVVYRLPPRPSELRPLHPDVDAVFRIALAKQRSERFGSAAALAEALEAALAGELTEALRRRAGELERRRPWMATGASR